jgi:hypothetical protein
VTLTGTVQLLRYYYDEMDPGRATSPTPWTPNTPHVESWTPVGVNRPRPPGPGVVLHIRSQSRGGRPPGHQSRAISMSTSCHTAVTLTGTVRSRLLGIIMTKWTPVDLTDPMDPEHPARKVLDPCRGEKTPGVVRHATFCRRVAAVGLRGVMPSV